ncbi:hypothetical protein ACP70R_004142 [Stipagrostis hirtigluma subsp. patula]
MISIDNGTAARIFLTCPDGSSSVPLDPLTGSAPAKVLPRLPDQINSWLEHAIGAVASDGTVFLYSVIDRSRDFKVALLRPGDARGVDHGAKR